VASFRAIGTLLVFGLLIGPPATASLLVRRVPLMMVTAGALSALAVVVGLAVSLHHDTARGATVAGPAVAEVLVALAGRATGGAASPPPGPSPGPPGSSSSTMWRSIVAPASSSHATVMRS